MKKIAAVLVAVMMIVTLFACANNELNDDSYLDNFPRVPNDGRPSWEYDQAEYELTWFLNASWMVWPTNGIDLVSRTIFEKTGCKIEIITATDDTGTELSTMISSGELPDVISVQASSIYANQLADQGYVYSIDVLMERFAPSMINRYHNEQKDVYEWFKRGNDLYGIPNLCYTNYYLEDTKLPPNGAILVREDWYNEVVMNTGEDMTSKESFISGCEYIKNKYKSSIPVQLDPFTSSGNLSVLWLSQYFAIPFEKEDGSYNYQIADERYEEVIAFLNTLYTMGFISDANLTANTEAVTRNISQGNVFVAIGTPQNYNGAYVNCFNNNIKYIPLVLKNDNNDAPILQDLRGKGYLLSMITRKAKRPDKIIQLFDFLTCEEGQLLINFGIEGDTFVWDENRERVVWTQKYLDDYANNDTSKYGFGLCNMLLNQSFYEKVKPLGMAGKKDYQVYIENLKKPLSPYSYDYTPSFLLHDTARNDYFSFIEKQENLNRIWGRYLPAMISEKNNEAAIKKYRDTIKIMYNNNMADVISFMNSSYQRTKSVLNITKGWPAYQEGYVAPVTGPNGDFSYWQDIEK